MKMERRAFDLSELEVRSDEDFKKIRGYAAVFDKLSLPLYGFREKIRRGAFLESIQKDDIRALWNHDPNYVLGRNKAGTLLLEEDERGLRIDITPPDAQWAKDLMKSIERKDISQMSFGFETQTDTWDKSDEKNVVRTLEKVRLFDVSPVTFPAYTQTSVGIRSAKEVYEEYAASIQEDEAKEVIEEDMEEKPETACIQEDTTAEETSEVEETPEEMEAEENRNQEIAKMHKILDLIEKEI